MTIREQVIISGENQAKGAFQDLEQGAKKGDDAMKRLDRNVRSLKFMHSLQMGARLAEKSFRLVTSAIGPLLQQTQALRAKNDALGAAWKTSTRQVEMMQAKLGDLLVPSIIAGQTAIRAFVDALADLDDKAKNIETKKALITWAADVARALVSGVATGANLAAQAIFGLKMAIGTLQQGAGKANAVVQETTGGLIGLAAVAADKAGYTDLRNQLAGLAMKYSGLADASESWGEAGFKGAVEAMTGLKKAEAQINSLVVAAGGAIDKGAEAGAKAAGLGSSFVASTEAERAAMEAAMDSALGRLKTASAEIQSIMKDTIAAVGSGIAGAIDEFNAGIALEESRMAASIEATNATLAAQDAHRKEQMKKLLDEVQADTQAQADRSAALFSGVTMSVYGSLKSSLAGLVDGSKSAVDVVTGLATTLAETIVDQIVQMGVEWVVSQLTSVAATKAATAAKIQSYAAEAAAAAFAANVGIPIIGFATASAAATAAAGAVEGIAAAQLALSAGGEVPMLPGSSPGRDSVSAMLTPGEMVVDRSTTSAIKRLLSRSSSGPGFADGGVVAPAVAGPLIGSLHISTLDAAGANWERIVENRIAPALSRGIQRGKIVFPGRRG